MAYDEDLAERLRGFLAETPDVTEKKMFGGLAFLVEGAMAIAAASDGGLLVRADPVRGAELVASTAARPFVMRGREMTGWLAVDADAATPEEDLAGWVACGLDGARAAART